MKICGEPVAFCTKPPGHEGDCNDGHPALIQREGHPAPPRPEVRPAPLQKRQKCDVWFYPPDHGPRDGSQVTCVRPEGHPGQHATEIAVEDLALDLADALRRRVTAVAVSKKAREDAEAAIREHEAAEKRLEGAVTAEQIAKLDRRSR